MARKQPNEPKKPEVDSSRLRQCARDAVTAMRTAQEELGRQAEELQKHQQLTDAERQRLTQLEATLAEQRSDCEARLAELAEQKQATANQRDANETARNKLDEDARELAALRQQLAAERVRSVEHRKQQDAATRSLREREHALLNDRKRLEEEATALGAKRGELQREREELVARAKELDTQTEQLAETRETLTTMQAQVARDHKEISNQRDAVLRQLGDVSTEPAPPPKPSGNGRHVEPGVSAPSPVRAPKPAASAAAEQFRKLRRDAKRRTIGV